MEDLGYRRIPKEIKDEILRKVKAGRTVKEVAEEHGVKSQSVYH
jgi:transposase-like protein